jgi:hypothetical protein
MTWRLASDTAEIDGKVAYPIHVLVACWYDGQFRSTFVCAADYWAPPIGFGARGGGSLGQCVVTHWQPLPTPPPEAEMLTQALREVIG